MKLNPTCMSSEVHMQVNHPLEENVNKTLLVNHSTFLAARADQETEKQMSTQSRTKPLMFEKRQVNGRTAANTHRERVRQKHIREAFDVLRSVIPDYFSQREPGDKLTRIKTLRLANKYIVMLHELLERSE